MIFFFFLFRYGCSCEIIKSKNPITYPQSSEVTQSSLPLLKLWDAYGEAAVQDTAGMAKELQHFRRRLRLSATLRILLRISFVSVFARARCASLRLAFFVTFCGNDKK